LVADITLSVEFTTDGVDSVGWVDSNGMAVAGEVGVNGVEAVGDKDGVENGIGDVL